MLFSLVPFRAISPDAKVIRFNGVKGKGRGAEKEAEKKKKWSPFGLYWSFSGGQCSLKQFNYYLWEAGSRAAQTMCVPRQSEQLSLACSSITRSVSFFLRDFQLGLGHIWSSRPSTGGDLHGAVLGEPLPECCFFCLCSLLQEFRKVVHELLPLSWCIKPLNFSSW